MKSPNIGELNGVWSILLRVGLAMQGPLLAWVVWVTFHIITIDATRFTANDAVDLRERMTTFITQHAGEPNHPPKKWVVDALDRLEAYHP